MNPNGLNVSHLNQFTDAGPLQEGCDMETCTDRVGGEHSPRCMRCEWCGRSVEDGDYVRISRADGSVGRCCTTCYERGDEGVDIGLDMTEDDFQNREGQPEFNGAFKSW